MQVAVLTHPGLVRQENEDGYLLLPEQGFFAVADGMGGHQAGAFASSLALSVLKEQVLPSQKGEDLQKQLLQAVQIANNKVHDLGIEDDEKKGMGTTLTALWIMDGIAHVAHVGDSRLYLLRKSLLTMITNDHSLVGELLRHGGLTQREAYSHPKKHMLTRALGIENEVKVDVISLTLMPGDLLLLCTDGLTNLVSDEEISNVFSQDQKLEMPLERLLKLALERGGSDNITILAILAD